MSATNTLSYRHAELSDPKPTSFRIGDRVERKRSFNARPNLSVAGEHGTVIQIGDASYIAVRWDTQKLASLADISNVRHVSASLQQGPPVDSSPFWSQVPYTQTSTLPVKSKAETYLVFLDGLPEFTWNTESVEEAVVLSLLIRLQERGRNVSIRPVMNNPSFEGLVATGMLD